MHGSLPSFLGRCLPVYLWLLFCLSVCILLSVYRCFCPFYLYNLQIKVHKSGASPVVGGEEPEEGHEGGSPGGMLEVVAGPVGRSEHCGKP